MRSFVLFNNKGGVGKTTLTFNIAHLLARTGFRTVVLDFDPQSNVTAIFLNEDQLTEIWENDVGDGRTVAGCLDPVRRGKGELRVPELVQPADNLWLLPGSLWLSRYEQNAGRGMGQDRQFPERTRAGRDLLHGGTCRARGTGCRCGLPARGRGAVAGRPQSGGAAGV